MVTSGRRTRRIEAARCLVDGAEEVGEAPALGRSWRGKAKRLLGVAAGRPSARSDTVDDVRFGRRGRGSSRRRLRAWRTVAVEGFGSMRLKMGRTSSSTTAGNRRRCVAALELPLAAEEGDFVDVGEDSSRGMSWMTRVPQKGVRGWGVAADVGEGERRIGARGWSKCGAGVVTRDGSGDRRRRRCRAARVVDASGDEHVLVLPVQMRVHDVEAFEGVFAVEERALVDACGGRLRRICG